MIETLLQPFTYDYMARAIWVSALVGGNYIGMMPGKYNEAHPELNRLGSAMGVMSEAENAPPEQTPPAGDIETA